MKHSIKLRTPFIIILILLGMIVGPMIETDKRTRVAKEAVEEAQSQAKAYESDLIEARKKINALNEALGAYRKPKPKSKLESLSENLKRIRQDRVRIGDTINKVLKELEILKQAFENKGTEESVVEIEAIKVIKERAHEQLDLLKSG